MPSLPARWSETKSPIRARSRSWARSPSPAARTSMTSATTSRSTSDDQVEAPGHLGMLGIVAQVDQRDELPGGIPVLAPAGQLVVAQLGIDVEEGRALGVLVDLGLPPQGGGRTQRAWELWTSGMVRPMRRATSSAGLPGRTSSSRRRRSWSTAWSTHWTAPGNSPISSSSTSGGMAMAPRAARGWGMSIGTGTTGTSHSSASATKAPPPATTIRDAPAS